MKLESLIWLTWRQHRWSLVAVVAVAMAAVYGLLTTEAGDRALNNSMPIAGFYALMVQLAFGAVVGSFWGAPLLARELEERTYFVAWGQDVTPVQWLRGKLIVFGGLAVLLGALVGNGDGFVGATRSWGGFEANSLVQVGYAVLGLSIGVLIGLLSRHVVTAMAATLVVFTAVRVFLAVMVRDNYLPSDRVIARWEDTPQVPDRGLEVARGFAGPDFEPVAVPDRCVQAINENTCMRNSKAAIGTYIDYQPIERLLLFQIIEFVLCALIAAALFAVIFRLLRNGGGWKPSRSHRRIGPLVPEDSVVTAEAEPSSEPEAAAEPEPRSEPESEVAVESGGEGEPGSGDQTEPETAATRTEG
ncbi:hypothetical protein GCM10011609_20280 [Lentzea pudingi]|uniref:ABC transporter permease n=1 Tax=Lentzea pudingi TaxID=1789439 RepID=A0ABQ2HK98_9PSEU|nr:PrgI family protein [Lentzea pudingi]GGM84100.1 hypothetical protein GCM10011609_20280 [Lentzea pudingi]